MTPGIRCCREDDDLAKAVRHREALKIRRLPVINGSKRIIGILSLGDVNHSASGDLLSECTGTGARLCPGNEVARVGAGLIDHLLAVGHGIRHVLESLNHRSVESDRHDTRRHDANAAVATIKELLRLCLDLFLHCDPPPGQYLVGGMPTTVSVSTPSAMAGRVGLLALSMH
jgi:hypothetical protein